MLSPIAKEPVPVDKPDVIRDSVEHESTISEEKQSDELCQKKYDAFVIHSREDVDWIEKMKYEFETVRKMKLCIPCRDWKTQQFPQESDDLKLNDCLSQSDLVLVIVTEKYLVSGSCQIATERARTNWSSKIIRVILQPGLPTKHLSGLGPKIEQFDRNVHENFFNHLAKLMENTKRPCERRDDTHQDRLPTENDERLRNVGSDASMQMDVQSASTSSESPQDSNAVLILDGREGCHAPIEHHDGQLENDERLSSGSSAGYQVQPEEVKNSESVAKFYNCLPEKGIDYRKKSVIFYLRNFNNWIKSVLIKEYLNKLKTKHPTVLDLCCGKGGDLLKWKIGQVGYLIMADIATKSVEQAEDRWKNRSRKVIQRAEFISADCTREELSRRYTDNVKVGAIDLTSCQFSFHYCFESESQAHMMIRNACEYLRPGGYFIGTMPNAYELVYRVKTFNSFSFGNKVYKVSFETKPDDKGRFPLFGAKYHFHLEGVVDVPEYLVYFPLLQKMLENEYGMRCVLQRPFHEFFYDNFEDDTNARLLVDMQALDFESQGKRDLLSGTISEEEWEAIGLYLVFAFHKPYNSSRRDESDTYLGSTGGGHEKLAEEKHGDKLGDKHDDKHCNEHDDKHDNEHDDEHNKHDNEHDREDYNKYCNRSSDEGNDSKRPCLSGDVQPD